MFTDEELETALDLRKLSKAFNPDELRDTHGQWTDGGINHDDGTGFDVDRPEGGITRTIDEDVTYERGRDAVYNHPATPSGTVSRLLGAEGTAHAFVSPNISSDMKLPAAIEAIHGPRQKAFMQAAHDVNGELGLFSTVDHPAVGAWADGAENASMLEADKGDFDRLRLATVMKGSLANQRAVLVFKDDPEGPAALYRATVFAKPEELHASLLKHGVPFHTLIPKGDATEVVVADLDNSLAGPVNDFAGEYHVQATRYRGTGEFIGNSDDAIPDAESRKLAQGEYERVIAGSPAYNGRSAGEIWKGIRDRWGQKIAGLTKRIGKSMTLLQVLAASSA